MQLCIFEVIVEHAVTARPIVRNNLSHLVSQSLKGRCLVRELQSRSYHSSDDGDTRCSSMLMPGELTPPSGLSSVFGWQIQRSVAAVEFRPNFDVVEREVSVRNLLANERLHNSIGISGQNR